MIKSFLNVGQIVDVETTFIDFTKYGFHIKPTPKFTAILCSGEKISDCLYEGFGDVFSKNGKIIENIVQVILQ